MQIWKQPTRASWELGAARALINYYLKSSIIYGQYSVLMPAIRQYLSRTVKDSHSQHPFKPIKLRKG